MTTLTDVAEYLAEAAKYAADMGIGHGRMVALVLAAQRVREAVRPVEFTFGGQRSSYCPVCNRWWPQDGEGHHADDCALAALDKLEKDE